MGGRGYDGDCWDWHMALWITGGSGAGERQGWPVPAGTVGRHIWQQQAESTQGGRPSRACRGTGGWSVSSGRRQRWNKHMTRVTETWKQKAGIHPGNIRFLKALKLYLSHSLADITTLLPSHLENRNHLARMSLAPLPSPA